MLFYVDRLFGSDARGIFSIEKTATNRLTDTYTVYYTDGTSSTFEIKNGEDGVSVEVLYEQYKEVYGEISYADFLSLYMTFENNDYTYSLTNYHVVYDGNSTTKTSDAFAFSVPNSSYAQKMQFGDKMYRNKAYKEALYWYEECIGAPIVEEYYYFIDDPKYAIDRDNCYCKIGNFCYERGEYEKASEYYGKASVLNNARALLNTAIGYSNRDLKMDKSMVACFLAKSAALGNERARELFYGLKKDGKL